MLVSSHVLSEVQQTVDDVVVIARGRLVRQGSLASLEAGPDRRARADADPRAAARRARAVRRDGGGGRLRVEGATTDEVGHLAHGPGSSCTS